MLPCDDLIEFRGALEQLRAMPPAQFRQLAARARATAQQFSMPMMAQRTLNLYERLTQAGRRGPHGADVWSVVRRRIGEEYQIWANLADAAGRAIRGS
jgi:hypothetical protein